MSQETRVEFKCKLNPPLGSQQFNVTKDSCGALMSIKSSIRLTAI